MDTVWLASEARAAVFRALKWGNPHNWLFGAGGFVVGLLGLAVGVLGLQIASPPPQIGSAKHESDAVSNPALQQDKGVDPRTPRRKSDQLTNNSSGIEYLPTLNKEENSQAILPNKYIPPNLRAPELNRDQQLPEILEKERVFHSTVVVPSIPTPNRED